MITVEHFMDIRDLRNKGHSIRDIAVITGLSRNTVRKVLRGQHTLKSRSPQRASKLDAFKDYLRQRFQEHALSAVRLIEEIRPMGYQGSLPTVRRFLRSLKQQGVRGHKLTVRFETPPGQQAQADWSYCGKFTSPAGERISVYVFVMVLSFSRMLFVRFTTSMKMPQLLECHQLAFAYFGGWTQTILYDNMKQVRIAPKEWNEQFLDFAQHYGFVAKTHRPYRARTKGKVERVVDYIKDNFRAGRSFAGLDDLNGQARIWLEQTANVRVHGTTGKRPIDLWAEEKLVPVNSVSPYQFLNPVRRIVNWESMVHFQGSRYSVPPDYAGKQVLVSASGGQILVSCGDTIIAEHRQAAKAGQCIVHKDHLAEIWKLTLQSTEPPAERRWHIDFAESVQRMPLSCFEEVLS